MTSLVEFLRGLSSKFGSQNKGVNFWQIAGELSRLLREGSIIVENDGVVFYDHKKVNVQQVEAFAQLHTAMYGATSINHNQAAYEQAKVRRDQTAK